MWNNMAKVGYMLLLLVFLLLVCVRFVVAADVSGSFAAELSYQKANDDSLMSDLVWNDFGSLLGGNLYIEDRTSEEFQYYLNLQLKGSLQNGRAENIPVDLTVNQLYVVFPLSETSFVYCGKKYKEIGVSSFFNVSNRISPNHLDNFSYFREPTGLIEYDVIQSDSLNYGCIFNFNEARNWDEVQVTTFMETVFGNLNMDGYLYLDKAQECSTGLNLSYQLGKYQIYLESILNKAVDQRTVRGSSGDPNVDFETRSGKSNEIVIGSSVSYNQFMAALEYLHREEGLNANEQEAFINYFEENPGAVGQLDRIYSRGAWLKDYLAIEISQTEFLRSELSLRLSGIFSLQPSANDTGDYTSCELIGSLKYAFGQNLALILNQVYRFGGRNGEFSRLYPYQYANTLALSCSF